MYPKDGIQVTIFKYGVPLPKFFRKYVWSFMLGVKLQVHHKRRTEGLRSFITHAFEKDEHFVSETGHITRKDLIDVCKRSELC